MNLHSLTALRADHDHGRPRGITSVCSAHPLVIEAALERARILGKPVLIEATCNQVNQDGGYTGMTPADFRRFVLHIAERIGIAPTQIILGGDHLGPNPWKHLPASEALAKAGDMIAAYTEAGFRKLHLDASMGCAGEPEHLSDAVVAERSAALAARAEAAAARSSEPAPVYIIGTEIPTPGGATETLETITPTAPADVLETYRIHKEAFERTVPAAWERVIGIVVQPGVEFGHDRVAFYEPARAEALAATLEDMPGLVFEAHSTDYQPEAALARLVRDGFPILKVGPELTFALRETLYGLDAIAHFLMPETPSLISVMEDTMRADLTHWRSHYHGDPATQRLLRHFSYSDRIRYYWPTSQAEQAVTDLICRLSETSLTPTLISQYLPRFYERVLAGTLRATPHALLVQSARDVLDRYGRAAHD